MLEMKEKVDKTLLRDYTRGKYSLREFKRIVSWFTDSRNHQALRNSLEEHWKDNLKSDAAPEKDLTHIYELLKREMAESDKKRITRERWLWWYSRAAAVLLIPLLVYAAYSIFRNPAYNDTTGTPIEVLSPLGGRTHFQLPDGTKVSLNSGTRLTYNSMFAKNRKVSLTGEAFFDVTHDPDHPFMVESMGIGVRVLGTRFNIVAFDNETTTEVVLEQGKVEVTGTNGSLLTTLSPDEKLTLDRTRNTWETSNVDASNLTAWKDGVLIFRSTPLSEVLTRLGRWYNVRFVVHDKEIETFRYRATFREEPLEEVLRLISLTAPIEYEISNRQMGTDGLYNEKVIHIRKKN
ncbi:FecR family protein [Bacteroidales bacterium 6E]|nr:FecR family protein [Bacteroidales bacterium 6E]